MSKNSSVNVFVGSLVTSALGGILVLLTDFAGWYNYGYYVRSWGSVGLYLETPLISLIIILIAAALFYCSFISFQGLRFPNEVGKQKIRQGLIVSIIAFAIVFLGALVFVIAMLVGEPSDWWFDTGFYGGLLGSGLTALLFFVQDQSVNQ